MNSSLVSGSVLGEQEFATLRFDSLRRRIRLLILLQAAESAGLVPIPLMRLHLIAFFSNVLAPVWDMQALDGKVLKLQGGPYYPAMQHDLDRLVGSGLAAVSDLGYVRDEENRWRLDASYRLTHRVAGVVDAISMWEVEREVIGFARELCQAVSALSDLELDRAIEEDATYSDPSVGVGGIVDFGEWRAKNQSLNAAQFLGTSLPDSSKGSRSEQLHLYARNIGRRLRAGA